MNELMSKLFHVRRTTAVGSGTRNQGISRNSKSAMSARDGDNTSRRKQMIESSNRRSETPLTIKGIAFILLATVTFGGVLTAWATHNAGGLVITTDADCGTGDADGAPPCIDDEPDQSDLNTMGFNTTHMGEGEAAPYFVVAWTFDETSFGSGTSGNTIDACAFLDEDNDPAGQTDFSICVSLETTADGFRFQTDPGPNLAQRAVTLWDCNNDEGSAKQGRKCELNAGPSPNGDFGQLAYDSNLPTPDGIVDIDLTSHAIIDGTFDSRCTIKSITEPDPFGPPDGTDFAHKTNGTTSADGFIHDTLVECEVYLDDLVQFTSGIPAGDVSLLNVCTLTSPGPNSNTADCIVPTNTGFIQIVKNLTDGTDDTFDYTLDSAPFASITTVGGSGFTEAIGVNAGPHTLLEVVDPDWVNTSAVCDNGTPDDTSDDVDLLATSGAFSVDAGEFETCTFVNELAFVPVPAIDIVKTAESGTYNDTNPANGFPDAGETIDYDLEVTNVGNVDLVDVSVNDPLVGPVTCPQDTLFTDPDGTEPFVGESMICTATYTLVQADIEAGELLNIAGAVGYDADGTQVTDTDNYAVPLPQNPSLTIDKVYGGISIDADGSGDVSAGDTLAYTLTATNNGNLNLTNVVVSDDLTGDSTTCAGPVAPGDTCVLNTT
jgi:uncharacterized repeat protein (TIGR01451 family)